MDDVYLSTVRCLLVANINQRLLPGIPFFDPKLYRDEDLSVSILPWSFDLGLFFETVKVLPSEAFIGSRPDVHFVKNGRSRIKELYKSPMILSFDQRHTPLEVTIAAFAFFSLETPSLRQFLENLDQVVWLVAMLIG